MPDYCNYLPLITQFISEKKKGVIRIYGHGASGKTTFTKKLIELLNPEDVNLLETDPYIIDGTFRKFVHLVSDPDQKVTANAPISHELKSLQRDILALKNGIDIITIDEPWAPSKRLIAEKPILIVEGMSAGFLPEALFDLSICLRTDPDSELERRLNRDVSERGQQKECIEQTQRVRRSQYENYYRSTEKFADILIDN